MCIAIVKPKGIDISEETLKNCHDRNKDGCGLAYIKDNKIYVYKTLDFDKFMKVYNEVKDLSNMLIHFRIATHGKVEENNCHPFRLNHRMVLIHNGIISGYGDSKTKDGGKTDTQDFIDKVIGNIGWKNWKNPAYRTLVGEAIGSSKLCVLDATGDVYIINEHLGDWVDGVWYSNTSYKPYTYTPKTYSNLSTTYTYDKVNNKWIHKGDTTEKKSWVNLKYGDDEEVWKCCECDEEILSDEWDVIDECTKCKSKKLERVGFTYGGKVYYYNDMYREIKDKTTTGV